MVYKNILKGDLYMTKKEYCQNHPATAYYSGFSGLEIHGIEYGINDYLYCVSGAWAGPSARKYHKLKIRCTAYGQHYIMLHGYKIPLSDCIRMGV
jgi:hypothetical protein